jgi:copper chaperone CopZ
MAAGRIARTKSNDHNEHFIHEEAPVRKRTLIVFTVMLSALFVFAGITFACDGKKGYTQTCDGSKGYTKAEKAGMTTDAQMASAKVEDATVMLNVSNMTGATSAAQVTKTLAAVDGVSDVKVSLDKGTAEVSYDAAKVKPAMLMAAVVKAGYPTTVADAKTMSGKAGCDPAACAGMKSADKAACKGGMKTADVSNSKSPDNQ